MDVTERNTDESEEQVLTVDTPAPGEAQQAPADQSEAEAEPVQERSESFDQTPGVLPGEAQAAEVTGPPEETPSQQTLQGEPEQPPVEAAAAQEDSHEILEGSPSEQAGGDPLPPPDPSLVDGVTTEAEPEAAAAFEEVTPKQLSLPAEPPPDPDDARLKAVLEAIVYVTDEPLVLDQIANALQQPVERVARILEELVTEYEKPHHGLTIRQVAGGYRLTTKPEHHDGIRTFVRNLKPPLKLSLAALETLAVIAYKQPITAPEIMEVRGVQGAGVLKTLLDRKLITTAGRKQVIGKPILYKTTREFLVQFGLSSLNELPTLKEFEELRRMAFQDDIDTGREEETASSGGAVPDPREQNGAPVPTPDAGADSSSEDPQ